jgi:hypothetical protein
VAGFCGHGDEHAFENKGLKKTLVGHTTDSCKKEDTATVLGHNLCTSLTVAKGRDLIISQR